MKFTKIALAVACVLGSAQVFAAAVTPAQISAAQTAGTLQQAWITGASAQVPSIYRGWVGSGTSVGCDPGTNTIFTNQAASSSNVAPGSIGNFFAYACTIGGKVSVLYHTVDAGSLYAYAPHTVGAVLARLKFPGTGNGCNATTVTYTDPTDSNNNATEYKGCSLVGAALPATGIATPATNAANTTALGADPLGPQKPVGGFSDVEAAILPTALGGGSAVNAVGTENQAMIGQVFGVVVSTPLYRALQVAQGIYASTAAAASSDPTYDPANAPNITSEQYTSIAAQGGGYQTDWSQIVGSAGTGHKVILARRVATSGTQASSTAFFLKNPCANGLTASLVPAGAADTTSASGSTAPGIEVYEASGTGNVKQRLTTAANSTGTDNFAIGVVSMENNWRVETVGGGSELYRFVKLDGVHPEAGDLTFARVSATNGNYPFHMESHYFVANSATGFGATILPAITAALATPPTAASCAVFSRGLTLNPLGGSICTVGAQVHKGTSLGNSCSPIQLFY